jgi:peptidoglycan/xylan/chitin deacetylase (PgdA/CDA1 family)/SAM-dependent methyltransferase
VTLRVVIPAYNAAETLAEALDSLLAQTRGDWQAIVVDDGSTDATRAIAERYTARDKRFRLLSDGRPRQGVSAARNRGIAAADGRWLAFLDADDWLEPAFVEKMIGKLEAVAGAKVAYCGCRRVTPDGRQGPLWMSSDVARMPFEVFARRCPVPIHGFALGRDLVVELGGFDESLRTCEDWDFWQRVARTGVAFLPVPAGLAPYRFRRNSLSSNVAAMLADARIVVERAFAADRRVRRPAQLHAGGADPGRGGTKEMAIGHYALWSAAVDIGAGGDGKGLVMPLPDRWGSLLDACHLDILTGLMGGARALPGDPLGDGADYVARVRGLLAEVERAAERPGLARLLEFVLEPEVFRPGDLTQRLRAGRALFVREDIRHLSTVEPPEQVDTLHIEFRNKGRFLARAEAPMLGALSRRELSAIAIEAMSPSVYLRESGVLSRPRFWLQAAIELAALPLRLPKSALTPRTLARKVLVGAAVALSGPRAGSNQRALADVIAEGRAQAMAASLPAPVARAGARSSGGDAPPSRDRRAYWEGVYRTPDPWAYGSSYEQLKYERTLSLLPATRIKRALEVACSEGRFSALLAERVEHLEASDISPTALERARERCRGLANVEFRRVDFFDEPLPSELDLLVCSEVLYDLGDRADLVRVAAKLAAALAPGGHLLSAHANLLKDDPSRTGFDWGSPFGAKVIAETLASTQGLMLERSLQTELYRIDLWRRLAEGETPPAPCVETVELGPPPEPAHAGSIVWDGADIRRADAQAREAAESFPVLMYHRIASDGPADLARYRTTPEAFTQQMRWLRKHGYHAVTSADLVHHLADGRPLQGRPVLLSFDDGYRDFHDTAWPILRAHDFTAEVMVVTDRVGGTADWDAGYGPPAPLMGWPEIQALAAAGIRFGSHMASHSHMAELSSREIALEAARSRALIERALGEPCLSIAAPFGEASDRFVRLAQGCGYQVGFTVDPGIAWLANDPLRLPRIEVLGDWSVEAFASALRPAANAS